MMASGVAMRAPKAGNVPERPRPTVVKAIKSAAGQLSKRDYAMLRALLAGFLLSLTGFGSASAATLQPQSVDPTQMHGDHPVYVQIIVKACHAAETPLQPTNQGKSYDDEKPMTLAERKAALLALGCIDVPIPMDWVTWTMTPEACQGHAGYLAAMEFLQQRRDLAEYPAVGSWGCIVMDRPASGVISQ
jgi:hypothetical protein